MPLLQVRFPGRRDPGRLAAHQEPLRGREQGSPVPQARPERRRAQVRGTSGRQEDDTLCCHAPPSTSRACFPQGRCCGAPADPAAVRRRRRGAEAGGDGRGRERGGAPAPPRECGRARGQGARPGGGSETGARRMGSAPAARTTRPARAQPGAALPQSRRRRTPGPRRGAASGAGFAGGLHARAARGGACWGACCGGGARACTGRAAGERARDGATRAQCCAGPQGSRGVVCDGLGLRGVGNEFVQPKVQPMGSMEEGGS